MHLIKIICMKNYLKTSVIYQVYVRNFTEEGTFNALESKLDYIKNLGVDIVYLLPISPIGVKDRKGVLGSPYSIQDYTKINPELGTLDDFKSLIEATHKKGMKIMIDIVYNHTSRDSWILKNHPEWMFHNKKGEVSNKIEDWSDVYDLDYSHPELIKYLVDVIDYYCSLGVDGYRFDVASLITKDFFDALKSMLNKKYPDTILLAESVHPGFVSFLRGENFNCLSDGELIDHAFDLLYPYNSYENLRNYLETKDQKWLDFYKYALLLEDSMCPEYSMRIRCLENHDQKALYEFSHDFVVLRNLAALMPYLKGPMFIYDGLETKNDHLLNLFNKDTMSWEIDEEWFAFIKKLIAYKKEKFNLNLNTSTPLLNGGDTIAFKNVYKDGSYSFGVFSLSGKEETINDQTLIDGTYVDYLTGKEVTIKDHTIKVKEPLYLFKK